MNKILIILSILMLAGCAGIQNNFDHHKTSDVYIDPDYTWANNGHLKSGLRSITLRVINKKYRSVKVMIHCLYNHNTGFFGKTENIVEARNDKTFTVYGFARVVPDNEKVSCYIKSVK